MRQRLLSREATSHMLTKPVTLGKQLSPQAHQYNENNSMEWVGLL